MDAVETIMELVCDCCHWPYVESEEGLEDRCEQCEIEKAIRAALTNQATGIATAIAESFREVLEQNGIKRAEQIDKRAE